MQEAKVLVTVSEGIGGERMSEYTHMQLWLHMMHFQICLIQVDLDGTFR